MSTLFIVIVHYLAFWFITTLDFSLSIPYQAELFPYFVLDDLYHFLYPINFAFWDFFGLFGEISQLHGHFFFNLKDPDEGPLSFTDTYIIPFLNFVFSVLFIVVITIWTRAAGPRFRLDQMSTMTWKDLFLASSFILVGIYFILLLV